MKTKSVLFLFALAGGACSSNPSTTNDLGINPDLSMAAPDLSMDLAVAPDLMPPALSVRAQRGLTLSPVTLDTSSLSYEQKELVGTGSYLAAALGCAGCHDATPATFMGGGRAFGTYYARNLTSHPTNGMKLTEAQFIEAMRTGKDFSDNGLLGGVMPYTRYRWMTSYDLRAIYAYLKAIPAVDKQVTVDTNAPGTPLTAPTSYDDGVKSRTLPLDNTVDPIGELRGQALQILDDPPNFALFSDASKRMFGRGAYLVTLLNCTNCHTNPMPANTKPNPNYFLSGGHVYPTATPTTLGTVRVMSANLTGQQHGLDLTQAEFVATLTTHTHANESGMRPLGSPMPDYKNLVEDDMVALYTYLTSVPRRTGANDKAVQQYARYCTSDANCNTAANEKCALAGAMPTNECIGKACTVDSDCDACQTCMGLACAAPASGAACLSTGL